MKLPLFLAALLLAGCAAAPTPPAPLRMPGPEVPAQGRAVVSAADSRGAAAGYAILAKGGNAIDAAYAMMLAMTVVEPQSSGIGGGGWVTYHAAASGRIVSIDGRESAPSGATPELFLQPDGRPMDFTAARTGGRAVGVPGNLRMMAKAHAAHGKLPWAALFGPAIALARDGFAVTPSLHRALTLERALLSHSEAALALYYQPDGSPKPVGTVIRNPALAALYERIAREGPDAFYRGPAAERLAATVRTAKVNPAPMTAADVAAYQPRERAPICGTYRGYRLCSAAPPSSGGIAVTAILKQIERFDMAALGLRDPRAWHLIGESMRLAYADRARWIGDPGFVQVPTAGLTEEAYLARRSALISIDRAMADAPAGRPAGAPQLAAVPDTERAGTTHLAAADASGNVVSLTSTVESGFGSGLVVDGYVLNNELTDFDFVPGAAGRPSANRVQPGKRPRSSMSPTIVYDPKGEPIIAIGAAGGPTIIAQVAKVLIGMIDWKLSVQDAIALPQIMGQGDVLRIAEGTFVADMADRLRAMGHKVEIDRFPTKLNGVERIPGGWRGGVDPRSEGRALGYSGTP